MDVGGLAANQGVPVGQRLAMGNEAVAAGVGQPVELHHIFGGDFNAIGHIGLAIGIIRTLMRFQA